MLIMSREFNLKNATALKVAYIGKNYHGWAMQPQVNEKTIEYLIRNALRKADVPLDGFNYASRTDKGVNAIDQTIKVDFPFENIHIGKINRFLPKDIRVWAKAEVSTKFSPRYSSNYKCYLYSYYSLIDLNINAMRKSATLLEGKHDFSYFSKTDQSRPNQDRNRNIMKLTLTNTDRNYYNFTLTAKSFLWQMCRRVVSHLIDIGKMEFDNEFTLKLLKPKKEKVNLLPDPLQPTALTLIEIDYPDIIFQTDKRSLLSFHNYNLKQYIQLQGFNNSILSITDIIKNNIS